MLDTISAKTFLLPFFTIKDNFMRELKRVILVREWHCKRLTKETQRFFNSLCVFLDNVSDNRQFEHLALIGFDHKNDPQGKTGKV